MFSSIAYKKLCPVLVSFACWIVTNFGRSLGHSRSKLCPILCRLRAKLCPIFRCSRARLCQISFAPCPFPNVAGTLSNGVFSTAACCSCLHQVQLRGKIPRLGRTKRLHGTRTIGRFPDRIAAPGHSVLGWRPSLSILC